MKKLLLLSAMLLLAVFLLSACAAPDPTIDEPEVTEAPATPAPTIFVPTPEPTVTPRPLDGNIVAVAADATKIVIDPADKPTRPPLLLGEYKLEESAQLGVSFEVPIYWEKVVDPALDVNTIVYQEPERDIRSGQVVASSLTISMTEMTTAQTLKDAQSYLDAWMSNFRSENPSLQTSSQDTNQIMGETGSYVTYWIDYPLNEDGTQTLRLRGRCLVVPVDRRLYMVRYLCPADFNSDYVNVFYKVRSTFSQL